MTADASRTTRPATPSLNHALSSRFSVLSQAVLQPAAPRIYVHVSLQNTMQRPPTSQPQINIPSHAAARQSDYSYRRWKHPQAAEHFYWLVGFGMVVGRLLVLFIPGARRRRMSRRRGCSIQPLGALNAQSPYFRLLSTHGCEGSDIAKEFSRIRTLSRSSALERHWFLACASPARPFVAPMVVAQATGEDLSYLGAGCAL